MSSKLIGRPVSMTLAAALAAVILATSAFAQGNPSQEQYKDQSPRSPSSTETPPTSPTPEASTSTPTDTPAPDSTAPNASKSTPQTTTPESTTGEPGGFPSITVTPTQGPPGTTVTITGNGWQDFASRGWSVDIQTGSVVAPGALDPLPARTSARPNADGTFSVPLTIPESVPAGRQVKIMAILGNGGSVDASFTVTPAKSVTPGGTNGQGQPSNPDKATKPQGPTPNGPGNSHQYTGGNSPKQAQQDQHKNGPLIGIRKLLNPIFGGGNAHKQGPKEQPHGGLIKQIGSLISSILPGGNSHDQGQKEQPQKTGKTGQDKNQGVGPTYCDYFPYVPSCQNGGTGPDFALPGVGPYYCDYFAYSGTCKKLQDFINKIDTDVRNGKIIGDTAGNKGECVGLVQEWLNYLGFSEEEQHVWGNAEALLRNADIDKYESYYDVIYKESTTDSPVPGDVIVWDASKSGTGGAGHTAVVISVDHLTGTFVVFEQNAPNKGDPPRISTYHNYDHVSGWLHPKV